MSSKHREKLLDTFESTPQRATRNDYDDTMRPCLDQRFNRWVDTHQKQFALKLMLVNHTPIEHFRILSPADKAAYLLDPDLPNNGGTLTLKANSSESSEVSWSCDTLDITDNKVTLTVGQHTITAKNLKTKQTHEVTINVEQL